ncbi:MAG: peptidylprolyl isomerase [Candidatus Firestonebacteria bacterium]
MKIKRFNIIWLLVLNTIIINFSYSETLVDKIIAVVNDEAIIFSEFNNVYKTFTMQINEKIKPEDEMNIKKKILEQMIDQRLIVQEAKRKNIEASKNELETAYENAKSNFGSEEQLKEYLASEGLTIEEFKQQKIKENLIVQKLINEMVKKNIEVSFSDVQNYYDKNIDKFKAPEEVKIRHILIKITDTVTEGKAKEKIESILKQIKEGKDFSELAKIYSDDENTKANGGDLGWFKKGILREELDKIAFSLKEGEISSIIKISNEVHLMKLDEKKEEKVYKLSDKININNIATEIREAVKDKVYEEKFREKLDDFVKKLKEKSVIEIKLN